MQQTQGGNFSVLLLAGRRIYSNPLKLRPEGTLIEYLGNVCSPGGVRQPNHV